MDLGKAVYGAVRSGLSTHGKDEPFVGLVYSQGILAGRCARQVLEAKLVGDGPWILNLGPIAEPFEPVANNGRAWCRVTMAASDTRGPGMVRVFNWPTYGGRVQLEGAVILVEALMLVQPGFGGAATSVAGPDYSAWITPGTLEDRKPQLWSQRVGALVLDPAGETFVVPPGASKLLLWGDSEVNTPFEVFFRDETFSTIQHSIVLPVVDPSGLFSPLQTGLQTVQVPPNASQMFLSAGGATVSIGLWWEIDL